MKQPILTGLAALTLLDISASTAEAQDWTGPYVGVHAGYRWADADLTTPAYSFPDGGGGTFDIPARSESYSPSGPIVGGHAGYNLLLAPNWLIGIEGDLSAGSGDDSKSANFISSDGNAVRTTEVELEWQGTIRARLGFVNGQWLLYATGGVAFADVDWTETINPEAAAAVTVSRSETLTGWVVGTGAEFALTSNTIVRGEYFYEDLGSMNVPLPFTTQTGTLDVVVQKVRVGISVKF